MFSPNGKGFIVAGKVIAFSLLCCLFLKVNQKCGPLQANYTFLGKYRLKNLVKNNHAV